MKMERARISEGQTAMDGLPWHQRATVAIFPSANGFLNKSKVVSLKLPPNYRHTAFAADISSLALPPSEL